MLWGDTIEVQRNGSADQLGPAPSWGETQLWDGPSAAVIAAEPERAPRRAAAASWNPFSWVAKRPQVL